MTHDKNCYLRPEYAHRVIINILVYLLVPYENASFLLHLQKIIQEYDLQGRVILFFSNIFTHRYNTASIFLQKVSGKSSEGFPRKSYDYKSIKRTVLG